MSTDELKACEDLLDVVEMVVRYLIKLGLLADVFSSPAKEVIMSRVFKACELILGKREMTPDYLRAAFLQVPRGPTATAGGWVWGAGGGG